MSSTAVHTPDECPLCQSTIKTKTSLNLTEKVVNVTCTTCGRYSIFRKTMQEISIDRSKRVALQAFFSSQPNYHLPLSLKAISNPEPAGDF
ncbi:hypothetical protein SC206_17850 [Rouxiella sp. T17]|uniref:hypothetical protein n=1 Tax=Rouxiella sp. T17 TaxID=3085684 RepID=UPI002FC7159E